MTPPDALWLRKILQPAGGEISTPTCQSLQVLANFSVLINAFFHTALGLKEDMASLFRDRLQECLLRYGFVGNKW